MTKVILPWQLEGVIVDIQRSYQIGLYYPALVVALTLPEICISLLYDKDRFVKQIDYVKFVDKYTTPPELGLNGIQCYRLRGGIIHRGNAVGHPYFGCTHVIFSVPETLGGMHAVSVRSNDKIAGVLNLGRFCSAMQQAVYRWFSDHHNNEMVLKNVSNILSWRPQGMPEFFERKPVLASGS